MALVVFKHDSQALEVARVGECVRHRLVQAETSQARADALSPRLVGREPARAAR